MISGHPDLRKSSLNLNYPRNSKLFNQKRVNHIAPGTSPSTRWRGNWRVISLYLPCQIFIGALFENSPCKVIFTDFSVLHIFYFLRLQLFITKGVTSSIIRCFKKKKKRHNFLLFPNTLSFDMGLYSSSQLKMSLFLHLLICDGLVSCFEQQKMVVVLLQQLQT